MRRKVEISTKGWDMAQVMQGENNESERFDDMVRDLCEADEVISWEATEYLNEYRQFTNYADEVCFVNVFFSKEDKNPIVVLAEKTGRSRMTIYYIARKLGRLPTEEEVMSQKKGRPRKYE